MGYACRSHDNADVQAALKYLLVEEARLKTDIAKLHADGGLDPYKRAGVVATYRGVIENVTRG